MATLCISYPKVASSGTIKLPKPKTVCGDCGTMDTPLWRKSSDGFTLFCNACGIRRKRMLDKHSKSRANKQLQSKCNKSHFSTFLALNALVEVCDGEWESLSSLVALNPQCPIH